MLFNNFLDIQLMLQDKFHHILKVIYKFQSKIPALIKNKNEISLTLLIF